MARHSSSVVVARFFLEHEVRCFQLRCTLEFVGYVCHLSVILFEFFGIPSSWICAFVEVFESVRSRPGFHSNSVGSLPVGGELSLFRVHLIPSEDEVTNFEFSFYDFLAMTSGYFLF